MNLKEKLQKIAKNKIQKTQQAATAKREKKPRVVNTKHSASTAPKRQLTFFPEVPVGFFGYNRPAEARPPTNKVRELTNKFKATLRNKRSAYSNKLQCIAKSNKRRKEKKSNKHLKLNSEQLFQCD